MVKWIDETHELLALKRWGEPEEIGYAAVFLASNRAAYTTGRKISVSDGFASDVGYSRDDLAALITYLKSAEAMSKDVTPQDLTQPGGPK